MLTRKEIKAQAAELSAQGKSKQEVYSGLKDKIDNRDSSYLSYMVLAFSGEKTRQKYRPHAFLLMALFSIGMIIWFFSAPSNNPEGRNYLSLAVGVIVIGLFNISLYKLEHPALTVLFLIGTMSFLVLLGYAVMSKNFNNYYMFFLPAAMGGYSFWLRKKIYPEIGLTGSVKKDSNGKYVFNDGGEV